MACDIHFIGMLRSPVSWAKVGRELIGALSAAGARVSAASLKGFLYDEKFPLAAAVEAAVAARRRGGWDLALDYPPNFPRLTGERRAAILIYEADRFPPHWAEAVSRTIDLAFVPSRFCLEAAADSGIPRDRLRLATFGVDTSIYRGDGPARPLCELTGRAFNFLAVAAPHVRKGLAETTAAFCEAFDPDEDAGLVIKCPPSSRSHRRGWEYAGTADFMPENRGAQVALVEGSYDEREMAALYRGADVYVQASYGEGFGLSLLEAAACGRPVIATAWGGSMDFLDARNAYLVDCELVEAGAFAYDWPAGEGGVRMARPRVSRLAETMRRAYENPAERAALAGAALETARSLGWERSARAIIGALEAFGG